MEIKKNISLFTTTYYNDFDLLDRLLESIVKYVGTNYRHYIVLNDDISHLTELNNILSKYPCETKVIHWAEFEEFSKPVVENCKFGPRTLEGWVTQIMITLLAAEKIETEYYLHLCSKDYFTDLVNIENMINNHKTLVPLEIFIPSDVSEQFYEFFENACKIFDMDPDEVKSNLIAPQTPVMNNTILIKQLLQCMNQIGHNIIDVIGVNEEWRFSKNKTVEYYLYSVWLTKMGLLDNIEFYSLYTNPYNKEHSYDLRRKT